MSFDRITENEKALENDQQHKAVSTPTAPIQRQTQHTASPHHQTRAQFGNLPSGLKSGIENLSGYDMSDVHVHYNSAKPRAVGALAYAQGNQIHLGAGQEKHLPHEAWHVVQQKQGRVKPTKQYKKHSLNDDKGLEKEADIMGTKADSALVNQHYNLNFGHPLVTATPCNQPQQQVIQRAVGMEFECSNLTITDEPDGVAKGDVLEEDVARHWRMTYEETAEGTPVVEFIVEPAAATRQVLVDAVTDIAARAATLDRIAPTVIGNYEVTRENNLPITAAIQVTMGVPLADIPEMFSQYRSDVSNAPSRAYSRFQALMRGRQVVNRVTEDKVFNLFCCIPIHYQTHRNVAAQVYTQAPDGTDFPNLSDELKGLLLILMDYIASGYVPAAHQGAGVNVPFVKSLYQTMARTDFKSMYDTLPLADKNTISELDVGTGEHRMRDDWWQWIIEISLNNAGLGANFLDNDQMINYYRQNADLSAEDPQGGDPTRRNFLRELPERDLLTAENYIGLGSLGNRADVSAINPASYAPVFELRKPYGASKSHTNWVASARETWDSYDLIVSERFNLGGNI